MQLHRTKGFGGVITYDTSFIDIYMYGACTTAAAVTKCLRHMKVVSDPICSLGFIVLIYESTTQQRFSFLDF